MLKHSKRLFTNSAAIATIGSSLIMSSSAAGDSVVKQTELSSVPANFTVEQVEEKLNEAVCPGFTNELEKFLGKEEYNDSINELCRASVEDMNLLTTILHEDFLKAGSNIEAFMELFKSQQGQKMNLFLIAIVISYVLYNFYDVFCIAKAILTDKDFSNFVKERIIAFCGSAKEKILQVYDVVKSEVINKKNSVVNFSNVMNRSYNHFFS